MTVFIASNLPDRVLGASIIQYPGRCFVMVETIEGETGWADPDITTAKKKYSQHFGCKSKRVRWVEKK